MKTILCYGDSNTWGAPIIHALNERLPRYPYGERWTGVLRANLGAEFLVLEEGLSGRTTVHDDPIEGVHKNGKTYLTPCLETHKPLEAVVLMLGTNDLKHRFALTPFDIAAGAGELVRMILTSAAGPEGRAPKVLLVCPPPILEVGVLADMFAGGAEKSRHLSSFYRQFAHMYRVGFLDAGTVIESSLGDGIHFELDQHAKLGAAIADAVRGLFA
jgi:lysophospholipase L1-like esterase